MTLGALAIDAVAQTICDQTVALKGRVRCRVDREIRGLNTHKLLDESERERGRAALQALLPVRGVVVVGYQIGSLDVVLRAILGEVVPGIDAAAVEQHEAVSAAGARRARPIQREAVREVTGDGLAESVEPQQLKPGVARDAFVLDVGAVCLAVRDGHSRHALASLVEEQRKAHVASSAAEC